MSNLRIASNLVVAASEYSFGYATPGHLQVVYGSDELEVQWPGLDFIAGADWDVRGVQLHDGSSYSSTQYAVADINLRQGQNEAEVWNILQQVQADIFAYNATYGIDYNVFQNSNSYAATILWVVGVDVSSYLGAVTPNDVGSGFPGASTNVLLGVSGSSTPISLDLLGTSGNDFLRAGTGNDTLSGGAGNDTLDGGASDDSLSGGADNDEIIGGQGNDTIDGGGGNDILWGGSPTLSYGFDSISGGAGDDIIHFDVRDTIDGGDGRDIAVYDSQNSSPFSLDVTAAQIEVAVGGLGNDALSADGSTETHLAGLDGNDTFDIDGGGGAPTIVWGGIGADTINIIATDAADPDAHDQTGILVVNVANLNASNFQDFDLSMIDVGAGFNWAAIDVVVVNPESTDRLLIDGTEIGTYNQTIPITCLDPSDNSTVTYGTIPYVGTVDIGDWYSAQTHHTAGYSVSSSLLGGNVTSVYAPTATAGYWDIAVYDNGIPGDVYINNENFRFEDYDDVINLGSAEFTSETYDENGTSVTHYAWVAYDAFGAPYSGGWSPGNPFAFGTGSASNIGPIDDLADIGPWFVVGGAFSGSGLASDGAYAVTMPEPPEDAGSGATDLSSSGGWRIVLNFDVASNVVAVNGAPINPNALGSQTTLSQNGSDTEIRENGALLATLVGVSLSAWQSAAATQKLGSAADDTLTGSSAADLFAAGAGNDTINAGAGDDSIIYTSGNDIIVGNATKNTGFDTLDLSSYSSDQVSFTIAGEHDVLITTPDGVIELDYQARYVIGDTNNNIDRIVFADMMLDEAAIRARALGDQSTAGNNSIMGSIQGDLIIDGLGNDTIVSAGGDDVIVYASGNDVIVANATKNGGFDTLDLSNYTASQVSFTINSSHDVLITTPDGVIELDYQVRYVVGDTSSNIEQILFSDATLDEAAIRARALGDQSTAGNNSITGSIQGDLIIDGMGNDTITAAGGDDMIVYDSGNDVIVGNATTNGGYDTLDLSTYAAADVTFKVSAYDVLITTPDGVIKLDYQVRYDIGNSRSNIEQIVFSDGTLNEAGIRARAISDQGTAGNDTISGTVYNDRIAGGLGNDTLSGKSGADTFVFTPGDGDDQITDFVRGSDVVEFSGLIFADLTITQSGSNTAIDYGVNDTLLLLGIDHTTLTQSDFVFV